MSFATCASVSAARIASISLWSGRALFGANPLDSNDLTPSRRVIRRHVVSILSAARL
jgi:hypothetical protein